MYEYILDNVLTKTKNKTKQNKKIIEKIKKIKNFSPEIFQPR